MRGDLALTARLLLRRTGLLSACAALGGVTAVVATTLPWWVATWTVTSLGRSGDRIAGSVSGVPGTCPGWAAVLLGAAVVGVAGGVAIDRPLPRARGILLVCAGALAAVGVASLVFVPNVERVAGEQAASLQAMGGVLPTGVEMVLTSHAGSGPLLLIVAALVIAVSSWPDRED